MAGRAGHEAGGTEVARRHHPAHVAHVGGTVALACSGGADLCGAVERRRRSLEGLTQRLGELTLLGAVLHASHVAKVPGDELRQRFVGQDRMTAVDELDLEPRLRRQRARLGALQRPRPDAVENLHVRVSGVDVSLREVRHDVGGRAAVRDDVVDPRLLRDVLAEELQPVRGQRHRVERGAAVGGRARGVGRLAIVAELAGDVPQIALEGGGIVRTRMPHEDRVAVGEDAGADHVDLAPAALLGRTTVETDRAGEVVARQELLDGDRREGGSGAEEVVTAAMARLALDARLPLRHDLLGECRQRVVLPKDADDRLAPAPGRTEARGHPADPALDLEARGAQVGLEDLDAADLFIADLGDLPDLPREVPVVHLAPLHPREDPVLLIGLPRGGSRE